MSYLTNPRGPFIPTTTIIQPNTTTHVTSTPSNPVELFNPKKAGKKTAHAIFVLDYSSSMQICREATIKGFNEFLEGQRASEVETFISLYTFNGSSVDCVHDHVDVAKVEPLNSVTYNPMGSTNLLDAIGSTMFKINGRLVNHKKSKRDSVTVIVLTDGEENSSRQYDNSDLKGMIEKAEGKEWSFLFLGANIDAFDVGRKLGLGAHSTIQYDVNNVGATMASASRMTRDMSMMKSVGVSNEMAYASATFTDEEREEANK